MKNNLEVDFRDDNLNLVLNEVQDVLLAPI